ncbi:VOC family protein [Nocardioides marmotae]|uniref:VOC family protein n=1 Tax=Nocardioides marmotae TaxID=2663857 RepID=UPI0012B530D4|nr:VOC family protein [Nocardioides marmotae]MBC9735170.1 VOC family protein [Nocardioides marmotae]MTB86270.1 VOC family protein [Nocardioides marmotae]
MSIDVTPHLNFRGRARAALEHYRSVFGGELVIATYGDLGSQDPAEADQVVFGQVISPDGFRVMAYDVPAARTWSAGDDPFFVSVRSADPAEITERWERLADGATVVQPLGPAAWAPLYGMLTDPFGVTWVLDVVPAG